MEGLCLSITATLGKFSPFHWQIQRDFQQFPGTGTQTGKATPEKGSSGYVCQQ